ncbi:hypothetical protein [Fibrobacter sp. UWB11]|uniref:hypothetical protein n=1 Tax=Fibrobacter sp. UWB11 TaxID=1896202 RepID=UPI0009274A29|nr:hypothetical protein [Fibrobacter sp. UWB11]SIO33377.1 hypothetical protein SAMN05720758_2355 [Fibrobacter sp. UWB11]
MLEWINQNSGLFSLLAVVASVIVPIVIYKKQRKDEMRSMQDELDAIKEMDSTPFPMSDGMRAKHAKINYLQKQLGKD